MPIKNNIRDIPKAKQIIFPRTERITKSSKHGQTGTKILTEAV